MKRPKKYGPGTVIEQPGDLFALAVSAFHDRRDVFIWRQWTPEAGRVEHIAWTVNQGFFQVYKQIRAGALSVAAITDEYRAWLAAENLEAQQ